MKKFINYLAVFIIFSGALTLPGSSFAESRVAYIIIFFVFLLTLPFLREIRFNKTFLAIFLIVTVFSLLNVWIGRNTLPHFMKQFIGIIINAVFFYSLIKLNDCDVKSLFKIYLNIALSVALVGIFQEISYLLDFKPGYDFHHGILRGHMPPVVKIGLLKINSIMLEPAHFCNVMMPAFFVSLTGFLRDTFKFQKKWKSVVIIFSFFLAFSTSGYAGAIFAFLLLLYNYRRHARFFILGGIAIYAITIFLYNNDEEFRSKVIGPVDILTGKIKLESRSTNISVYALTGNALVAYYSFRSNPFFGSGLGSHQISFERCLEEGGVKLSEYNIGLNPDGSSLFLRLLSEAGLFGVSAFFIFIFKFYISRYRDKRGYFWIISNAILCMFFTKLLRMGHYFVDGFFFFLWMYYFTSKAGASTMRALEEKPEILSRGAKG